MGGLEGIRKGQQHVGHERHPQGAQPDSLPPLPLQATKTFVKRPLLTDILWRSGPISSVFVRRQGVPCRRLRGYHHLPSVGLASLWRDSDALQDGGAPLVRAVSGTAWCL